MARTLTAGANTQKEAQATSYDVLVESEDLNLRYSFSTTTAGGHTWEHRLLHNGIGDIVYDVATGGGLAAVSSLTITVIDDGLGQSPTALINTLGNIRGADLSLSILLRGEVYANKIIIYANGLIDDYRKDGLIAQLVAVDATFRSDLLLPQNLIPQNDPAAANTAIGRALPVLFGRGLNIFSAPLLNTDEAGREYKAASHPLRSISQTKYSIYNIEADLAKSRVGDGSVDASNASLTLTKSVSELLFGFELGVLNIAREQDVTNSSLAIDFINANKASINTDSFTDVNGEGYGFLGVGASFTNPQGSDVLQYDVFQHRGSTGAAATLNASFRLRMTDSGGIVLRDDLDRTPDFRFFSNYRDFRKELRNVVFEGNQKIEVFIEAFNEGGLGTSSEFWEVGEVRISLAAQAPGPQAQLFLFLDWEGKDDDGSGTYTGTPGNLIEKPGDLIFNVIGEEIGLTGDSTSFTNARSRLTDWLFNGGVGAGWFRERVPSRIFLNDLSRQAKSIVFPADNGLKILPFDSNDAVQYAFTTDTILWQAGTSVDSLPSQRGSTVRIDNETVAEIWNRFEIRYGYNAGSGKFDKIRFCNSAGTNTLQPDATDLIILCLNSENTFGKSETLRIDADFIYDDDTAEFLLSFLVQYFWNQRFTMEWETGTQGLHLQLGDFVSVTHPDLPTVLQGGTFEIHRVRYRFIPATGPHGNTSVSFRIGLMGSNTPGVGGIGIGGDFDYLCIQDQSNVTWYAWIVLGQILAIDATTPTQLGLTPNDITPVTVPHWLKIETDDSPGVFRYVYPDDVTRTWVVDTVAPAVGTEFDVGTGLAMESIDGIIYTIKALSIQQYLIE